MEGARELFMPRQSRILLLCSLLGPLVGACDDSISSASQLKRLRLLTVQAEPPNPRVGQPTVLRPLVYVPPGEDVTYEWSWCPVPTDSQEGYRCPVEQVALDTMAAQAGLSGVPPLALGTGESVVFTNPFPPTLLASLCSGDSAAMQLFGVTAGAYDCSVATLSMQVMLTVRGSTTDTGVVSLRLPIDDSTAGNHNPLITGIAVIRPEPMRLLDDTGLVRVPRDRKVDLRALIASSEAESYLDKQLGPDDEYVRDEAGHLVLATTQERVTLSWFTEGGGFVERLTSWSVKDLDSNGSPLPFEAATDNPWTTPKVDDYGRTSSLILVVARDNRGGVAWTRGAASFEDAP